MAEVRSKTEQAARDLGWTQGFACAAALCMRTHHEDQVVRDILRGVIGHGPKGMRAAFLQDGADPYDIEWIDKAFGNGDTWWFGEVRQ